MPSSRPTLRKLLLAISIPLLAFLTLAAWSFASAGGSSPDDDFHLPSIWCGAGERADLCELPAEGGDTRLVPTPLVTATCYVFQPAASADCWLPEQSGLTEVERVDVNGLYPPVFYATMSIFASSNVPASILAMRLFNSALTVGFLTAVFFALPRRMRPALVISVAATSVPLGLSVFASTNPSAWALLSAATVWITLYAATQTRGRHQWVLSGLALLATLIGAGARADAAVYAVFAVGLAAILGLRFRRGMVLPTVVALLVIALSAAFYLGTEQGSAVVDGLRNDYEPLGAAGHLANFLEVPSLWVGAIGGWGIGWLDTNTSATVSVLTTGVFFGAIFIGIKTATRRRLIAIVLAIAAMWLVPFILLAQSNAWVGVLVQPRYILPLMVITIGVASLRADAARAWKGSRFVLASAALWFAATVALHRQVARYTTGLDRLQPDPGGDAEWWWALGPSPLAVWVIGTLAFAGVFVGFWFVLLGETVLSESEAIAPFDEPNISADEPAPQGGTPAVNAADGPSSYTPAPQPSAASTAAGTAPAGRA